MGEKYVRFRWNQDLVFPLMHAQDRFEILVLPLRSMAHRSGRSRLPCTFLPLNIPMAVPTLVQSALGRLSVSVRFGVIGTLMGFTSAQSELPYSQRAALDPSGVGKLAPLW
jgi:hypothetical protein